MSEKTPSGFELRKRAARSLSMLALGMVWSIATASGMKITSDTVESADMKSSITGGSTTPLFRAQVLGKYSVQYYRCNATGYIQSEKPYWLEEAYADPITALDIGLVQRNIRHSKLTARLIERWSLRGSRLIDYAGGYGLFTRLMRDAGYPFLHHDQWCTNLFAVGFEAVDFLRDPEAGGHDLLTAWEVFEHLPDPLAAIEPLVSRADRVLFSTVLVPTPTPRQVSDWWYFTPQTGQHISFYTIQSLRHIAETLGTHFYTDGVSLHLFSRQPASSHPFRPTWMERLCQGGRGAANFICDRGSRRTSLLDSDFKKAIERLTHQQAAIRVDDETT